jgi:hypothetical protein
MTMPAAHVALVVEDVLVDDVARHHGLAGRLLVPATEQVEVSPVVEDGELGAVLAAEVVEEGPDLPVRAKLRRRLQAHYLAPPPATRTPVLCWFRHLAYS